MAFPPVAAMNVNYDQIKHRPSQVAHCSVTAAMNYELKITTGSSQVAHRGATRRHEL